MRAIDASVDTSGNVTQIKRAGVSVVIRYCVPGRPKTMGRTEATALRTSGIAPGSCYETTADMMISGGGRAAGIIGAGAAEQAIAAAGGPGDAFVWFASDTDKAYYANVAEWLRGANTILGVHRCGIYGPGALVAYCLSKNVCRLGWRSMSTGWRGYLLRPKGLVLLQSSMKYGSLGFSYDADDCIGADVGQWGYAAPTTVKLLAPGFYRLTGTASAGLRHHWQLPAHSYNVLINETVSVIRSQWTPLGNVSLCSHEGHAGYVFSKWLIPI